MIGEEVRTVADCTTGERFFNVVGIETLEQRRAKEKQRAIIKAEKEYAQKVSSGEDLPFSFSFMDRIPTLLKSLEKEKEVKSTYLGYLLILQTYMDYSNVLKVSEQGKPMKRKDIGEVTGQKNKMRLKVFIDLMLKKGIFSVVQTKKGKGFKMNKKYVIRGEPRDKHTVKVFNETVRDLYKENSAESISFLYKLIPYISSEDNVICHNPYERDPTEIECMTVKDIAEVTGLTDNSVHKKKSSMTFKGMAVFKTEIKNGKYNFVINPLVFYRKKYEPDNAIVRSFRIKGK